MKPIFGDFVNQHQFSMLFNDGLSIFRNLFWVHIRCRFEIRYIKISCSTTVDPCRLVVLAAKFERHSSRPHCVSTQFITIPAHFTLSSTGDKGFLVNSSKLNTISRVALLDLH